MATGIRPTANDGAGHLSLTTIIPPHYFYNAHEKISLVIFLFIQELMKENDNNYMRWFTYTYFQIKYTTILSDMVRRTGFCVKL